ncbi:MAG: tRNA pseudouridine(38-40) synthase TruA [Eubacteriales bacterium]|nr:tRNA pseudouridine(38-40) synthase TruA [Eubacteriales bacterium]
MNPSLRILLTLEYEGTRYAGWQRQLNGPSVQEEVEKALEKTLERHVTLTGASRTDAGVHALGQRAHFDTGSRIPPAKWPFVLNTLLPRDISAVAAREVPETLHARFSALGKRYSYRILNRPQPSAILRDFSAFVPLPLDDERMARALPALLGRHDFAAFAAAGHSAKTTVRTIQKAEFTREGKELRLVIEGDAFLYNMVRIIAGTLIAIGLGRLDEDAFQRGIDTGDRLALGPTAPACGLTLEKVWYPGE